MGQHPEAFLAGILTCFGFGIVIAKYSSLNDTFLWTLLLIVVVISLYGGYKRQAWTFIAVLAAFFVLGMLRWFGANMLPANDISGFAKENVILQGILREEPQISGNETDGYRVRYLVKAVQVKKQAKGEVTKVSGNAYINTYVKTEADIPKVYIGDKITAGGKIRLPKSYHNPGQLDIKNLLYAQGITAMLTAGKGGIKVEAVDTAAFLRWIVKVREHYRQSMESVMPGEDASAIFAMLFGGYGGIKPELLEAFTVTGIVHILSVSGSHISLIAAVMAALAGAFRLPRLAAAILVITTIVIYSILAGCVPPVIRSAIMGGLTFLALAMDRERDARYILLLTGLVMLIISPLLIFNISFELSFLATAGLLYLAPVLRRFFSQHGCNDFIAAGLAITIAAQLATLPILAWYFNQLSLVSLLANLVVVPIVEIIIIIGLLAGVLALIMPFLGKIVFGVDSLLLGLVYELTRRLASIPFSQIWLPALNVFYASLYYLLLGSLLLTKNWRDKLVYWLKAKRNILLIGFAVFFIFNLANYLVRPLEMAVHFVDVGQGDCVLVITPHGKAMLFDTGGSRDSNFDVGQRVCVPYLRHYGILELPAVFLTHAHEDHAAGCKAVLHQLNVGHVYTAAEGLEAYASSMKLGLGDEVINKITAVKEGKVFYLDGVKVEVIFAPQLTAANNVTGNEISNVYRISYGKASFLITGDMTKEKEKEMLEAGINPASTVLKAGHHGSDTSSSAEFLEAVKPAYAVFCVGADNSFGHPKPKVLARYAASSIKIFRTDEDGAVVFHTDGDKMRVETYNVRIG